MYFAGKRPDLDFPLDLSPPGDFTGRAWKAAQGIPYGRRLTYRELAQRAGCPGGARAAGRAMAKNPVPIIVPCHRVVGARNIGGFSSGIAVKTRLLSLEGGGESGCPASRTPGKKSRLRTKR
jgi:O-6-methylguanine DNA methyltransferase